MISPKPFILIDTAIVGGPGRGLFQLISYLKEKSIDYVLCTFQYRKPKTMEFIEEASRQHIKLAALKQSFKFDPMALFECVKLIRAGHFNLIQSHGYKSHLVAFLAAKITKVPWVAFAHGWTSENAKVVAYHKLDKLLLRFADVVITVSPKLQNTFLKIRGKNKNTTLILNAVDPEALKGLKGGKATREECGCKGTQELIGCFGRLSFEKGQDLLIQAIPAVVQKYPQVKFLFLGDGPEATALKELTATLGISDNVCFQKHSTSMRDYYEAIDLLVLPSRSEGLPNVVLEAMAFRVPVIAADVGAVREVISDQDNGWIVPSGDVPALSTAIIKALEDRNLRNQVIDAATESLNIKFCPVNRAKKILNAYNEALSAKQYQEPISAGIEYSP